MVREILQWLLIYCKGAINWHYNVLPQIYIKNMTIERQRGGREREREKERETDLCYATKVSIAKIVSFKMCFQCRTFFRTSGTKVHLESIHFYSLIVIGGRVCCNPHNKTDSLSCNSKSSGCFILEAVRHNQQSGTFLHCFVFSWAVSHAVAHRSWQK